MLTPEELQELINKNIEILKSTSSEPLSSETIKLLCTHIPTAILNNDPAATYLYALMYKHGVGVSKNDEEYIKYLVQAIILRRQEAERDFWDIFNSNNCFPLRAFTKTIADSGNFNFAYTYAVFCEHGAWGDKNIPEAIKYYEIAASLGPIDSIDASPSARDAKQAANRLKEPDDRLKVKQPYFFKVKYQDKTAYLLGTIHIVGWNVFPTAMQEIIRGCSGVISEGSPGRVEYQSKEVNLYLPKYIRQEQDLDWFSLLPFELQNLCSKIWLAHLALNPSDLVEVADLKISTVIQLVGRLSIIRSDYARILQDTLETQYNNISNIYGKMDFDIENRLELKGSLEQEFVYDKISCDDEEEDQEDAFAEAIFTLLNIVKNTNDEAYFAKLCHDLENSLKPLLSESPHFNDLFRKFTASKYACEDIIKHEMLDTWERYARADDLYNLGATITLEQTDINKEGSALRKRNAIMLESALCYINKLAGPILITCGESHLLGRTGLITTLTEAGAELELYDSNTNSFKPYVYPYKYYLMALENIKRGMFFSSASKFNCTAIIPYTSQEEFLSRFKPRVSL